MELSWGDKTLDFHGETVAGWVHPQPDPNQYGAGYYGYSQGYESYGYAPLAQDPNMYAYGAYLGYRNYQQQQGLKAVIVRNADQKTIRNLLRELMEYWLFCGSMWLQTLMALE